MDTARLFVGCLLDLAATRRCLDVARALRRSLDAAGWQATWVPPANVHVTLRFLGEVDAGTAPAVAAALAAVARAHPRLELSVRGLLALPSPEAPRVLALEVADGHAALEALARAVDDACFELGFPRAATPFRGHVTLARVKRPEGGIVGGVVGGIDALAPHLPPRLDAGVATASELTLWRSDLTRLGAEHHALARHALVSPRSEGARAPRGQDTST